MNTEDFTLSPDTQAVLLLCGPLGRDKPSGPPLTLPQYNALSRSLNALGKRPADLLAMDDSLIDAVCGAPSSIPRVKMPEKSRVCALLRRGMALSDAVARWAQCGIHVMSRADGTYPKRLKEHLKLKAPALLYYCGDAGLFTGGGLAFVGSRDLNENAAEAIRTVAGACVDQSLLVVSGGARGADQTAMHEAFSRGGKIVGALPCDLLKTSLDPDIRDALASGRVLLFSATDPEQRPYSYGAVAMDRNKYIYAMADACFVAQSGVSAHGKQSGTYEGAIEELAREPHRPVFVYLPASPSEGCVVLVQKGAKVWKMDKSIAENLESAKQTAAKAVYVGDLFSNTAAVEPAYEYGKVHAASVAESPKVEAKDAGTPYALVKAWLMEFLSSPRNEKDVKKHMSKDFDLVASQIKHWLEKLEQEGLLVRKEYPKGKKGKVVMCERV